MITLKDILDHKRHVNELIIGIIFREGSAAGLKNLELDFDQTFFKA
jgi:hypothetical protein